MERRRWREIGARDGVLAEVATEPGLAFGEEGLNPGRPDGPSPACAAGTVTITPWPGGWSRGDGRARASGGACTGLTAREAGDRGRFDGPARSCGPPEEAAGPGAGLDAVTDGDAAVDDDLLDADGVVGGLLVGRAVGDGRRVEDDEWRRRLHGRRRDRGGRCARRGPRSALRPLSRGPRSPLAHVRAEDPARCRASRMRLAAAVRQDRMARPPALGVGADRDPGRRP